MNGNLTSDLNKAISSITYNHLNLSHVVTITGKDSITYTYSAAGYKLRKETIDNTVNPSKTTTTTYIGSAVYENDVLQFVADGEGRIRFKSCDSSFQYDDMLKDHLGNVRMVLTTQKQTDAYPVASLETTSLANEKLYYSGLDTGRVNKNTVSGYPSDTYTNPNDFIQKLNGNGAKTGTGIVLKVMAGDKFNIRANSWYRKNGVTPGTPVNPLADLVAALAGSVGSISSVHGGATTTELASSGVFTPGVTSFLNGQTVGTGKPKAYVNWVLFDEQVKLVSNSSGFDVAGNDQEFKTHLLENKLVDKNGYLYIYVSNETPNIDVFFDNLQVTHIRGPILEETHYYPFGLVMQGISSKALAFGGSLNRKKFNGVELSNNEFSDGSGLEWYDTDFRRYDQQIGRFTGIDALSELNFNWSPYAFAQNNPILFSDPYGLDTVKGQLPNDYNPQPGDVWINDGKTTIYDQERGWAQQQELGEVVVGNNPANTEAYNAAQSALTAAGCYVIGWDYYYNMRYKGDWMYRNSKGKITSIFDTKWGSNKTPDNLGNIKNYSQNAQKGIRATRVVKIIKTASGTIVVLSTLAEWGQAFYAYSTNDSNADALLAKAGVSTGVTLLSATLPGVGWTIGGIYFLIDATIGWENAIPSYIEVEKNKADMRTLKITNFSDFKF